MPQTAAPKRADLDRLPDHPVDSREGHEAGVVSVGSDRSPESSGGRMCRRWARCSGDLPKFERLATPFAGPEAPPDQLEWPV